MSNQLSSVRNDPRPETHDNGGVLVGQVGVVVPISLGVGVEQLAVVAIVSLEKGQCLIFAGRIITFSSASLVNPSKNE